MKFVTSLNPNPSRLQRQKLCVDSWLKYGYEIVALQPYSQVDVIRQEFPDIFVRPTNSVGELLGRPNLVEIHAHASLALEFNEPIVLINSDIELTFSITELDAYWAAVEPGVFKVGIRWNHDQERANLCPYGIDMFQITPEQAILLPNLGFVIGCPTWDYWIIHHLHQNGYTIHANKAMKMLHEIHIERWDLNDYNATCELFNRHHSINHRKLSAEISRLTGRTGFVGSLKKKRLPLR